MKNIPTEILTQWPHRYVMLNVADAKKKNVNVAWNRVILNCWQVQHGGPCFLSFRGQNTEPGDPQEMCHPRGASRSTKDHVPAAGVCSATTLSASGIVNKREFILTYPMFSGFEKWKAPYIFKVGLEQVPIQGGGGAQISRIHILTPSRCPSRI